MTHRPAGGVYAGQVLAVTCQEFLNVKWPAPLAETPRRTAMWRADKNQTRPQTTHCGNTPAGFAEFSGRYHASQNKLAAENWSQGHTINRGRLRGGPATRYQHRTATLRSEPVKEGGEVTDIVLSQKLYTLPELDERNARSLDR
jgi:hypothetical protein